MGTIAFEIALTFYFAAAIVGLLEIFRGSRAASVFLLSLSGMGFLLHTVSIVARYAAAHQVPIASPHEATSFFAWCVVFLFFVFELRYRVGLLGSFVMPLVFALMLASSLFSREIKPLEPVLQSNWLLVHTVLAFMANAAFGMAAGVGAMYLLQEHFVRSKHLGDLFQRLPSLQRLDEMNSRLITVGFPLFTFAIVSGMFWADRAWGSYWRWDPREVWSLITWLIFAMIVHSRLIAGWRGRRASVLTIVGFLSILVAFFGVKFLQKGLHVFL